MNFNEKQMEAIKSRGNVALLASSGSGKSAVVIERIKNLISDGVEPGNILSVTFSNQAVENLKNRLAAINIKDVVVSTFHSLAFSIIKKRDFRYNILSQDWRKKAIIIQALKNKHYEITEKKEETISEIMKWISTQEHYTVDNPNDCKRTSDCTLPYELLKNIYKYFMDYCEKEKLVTFDGMCNLAVRMLNDSPGMLKNYQDKFQYILVDETQDVSMNQFILITMLNKEQLFMVGDPKQSIYRFRHSNPDYLVNLSNYVEDVNYINMNINYRSREDIVYLSNCLAKHDSVSKDKNYIDAVADKAAMYKPLYIRWDTEHDMIADIRDRIKYYVNELNYSYNDILILARTNAELQDYEVILSSENIPYKTYNNKCFLDNSEIDLVVRYLLLAYDINDNESFGRIYNKPNDSRYFGKDFINTFENVDSSWYEEMLSIDLNKNYRWKTGIQNFSRVIEKLRNGDFDNVGKMIKYLRRELDLDDYLSSGDTEDDNKINSLDRFQDICKQFTSLEKFIKFTESIRKKINEDSEDKVSIMTAHKSKGLEYKIVFVTGMSDGQFPHSKSISNNDDLEAELRLFYVACTRAEDILIITSAVDTPKCPHESRFIEYLGDSADKIMFPVYHPKRTDYKTNIYAGEDKV